MQLRASYALIKAGPVSYVALEDDLLVFWHRIYGITSYLRETMSPEAFEAVEAAMDNIDIHALYGLGYRPMTVELALSPHFQETIDHVRQQGARLVIIDTYSRFLAGHSKSDNAVASSLVSLVEQLCQSTGAATLILHQPARYHADGPWPWLGPFLESFINALSRGHCQP